MARVLSEFSMFWGATFFPPAVTMMSFFRSVMRSEPSGSISPMSPVRNQPSGAMASWVASGFL